MGKEYEMSVKHSVCVSSISSFTFFNFCCVFSFSVNSVSIIFFFARRNKKAKMDEINQRK